MGISVIGIILADRVTNEEVFKRLKEKAEVSKTMKVSKLDYFPMLCDIQNVTESRIFLRTAKYLERVVPLNGILTCTDYSISLRGHYSKLQ